MDTNGQMAIHDGDLRFAEDALRSVAEVLQTAQAIRKRLGEKRTILDCYMKSVLSAIAEAVMTTETSRSGFENSFVELRGLCQSIRYEKPDDAQEHPFYPVVKEFINRYDIPKDALFYETCCVGLFPSFSKYIIRKFHEQNEAKLRDALQENHVSEAKTALGAEIGQPAADDFHESVLNCFIAVPQTRIFAQALLEQVISSLLVSKDDSENYVFVSALRGDFL